MNGVIWVDRKNKKSRADAYYRIISLLKKKKQICIFPEGTWNLTDSQPMLPLYWGCIELAKETKSALVPIILEYKGDICIVNPGKPVYVMPEETKDKKIGEITDIMATLKWEIWERFPMEKRRESMREEWEEEVLRRLADYPKLDYEYEKSCIRR